MLKLLIIIPLVVLYYNALMKIKDWRISPIIYTLALAITLPAYVSLEPTGGQIADMLGWVAGVSAVALCFNLHILFEMRKDWIKYNDSPYITMGYNKVKTFKEFYEDDVNHNHPTY